LSGTVGCVSQEGITAPDVRYFASALWPDVVDAAGSALDAFGVENRDPVFPRFDREPPR
jgi:hypothetical protein